MTDPQDIVDRIDELVNDSLAQPITDSYDTPWHDRSGELLCTRCNSEWHGLPQGRCPGMTMSAKEAHAWVMRQGDYDDQARLGTEPDAPWGGYFDQIPSRRDIDFSVPGVYTMADIEALRQRSWVRTDYPQRYIIGGRPESPRVRFWSRNPDNSNLYLVEGTAQVLRIDWTHDGVTVAVRLDPVRQDIIEPEMDQQPAGTIPDGMVAMEGFSLEGQGFEPVGYLAPEDIDIEYNQELAWGNDDRVACVQERCEATIRLNFGVADPLLHRLGGDPNGGDPQGY